MPKPLGFFKSTQWPKLFFLVFFAIAPIDRGVTDRYDDEEAIRRLVQKHEEEDKRLRQEAKARYDQAHPRDSGGSVWPCCMTMALPIILIIVARMQKE